MLALPEVVLSEDEIEVAILDPEAGAAGRGVGRAKGATSVSGVGSVVVSSPSGFLRRNIVNPLNIDLM